MKIEVFAGSDADGELISTFTISGLDEISESDLSKKDGVSKPRVLLSFELSRSGIVLLNKAEAKIEEIYTVSVNKTSKNDTSPIDGEASADKTTESEQTEKVQKKRSHPYPLNRIERESHGLQTLSKEQLQLAKDRLRWYENRDELRMRTDKAKNDFESVIYAMRGWLTDHGDSHQQYIGSTERLEELLTQLSENENWLIDGEGEYATYVEYNAKFGELDSIYRDLKIRKDEHQKRPQNI